MAGMGETTPVVSCSATVAVPITNSHEQAYVDEEFADVVLAFTWFRIRNKKGAHGAVCFINKRAYCMHRLILGLTPFDKTVRVRHADGNKLNNKIQNLRICTPSDCAGAMEPRSTSGFKGVRYDRRRGKFCASIYRHGKSVWLGHFDTAIEAAKAYDLAAAELFKENAMLNAAHFVGTITI